MLPLGQHAFAFASAAMTMARAGKAKTLKEQLKVDRI
jgi:hypothetical protein